MLRDLERILDGQSAPLEAAYVRRKDLDENHFSEVSQYLIQHQFLYRADHGCRDKYDLLTRFIGYFENLFAGLGYNLVHDEHDQFAGIVPAFESGRMSWKMDETILLLVFRLAYQEEIQDAQVDEHGAVHVLSDEILSKYETLTQKERPGISRFKEILTEFRRRGIVGYDRFEEKETIISIRPAISVIMGGDFMQRLEAFNESGDTHDAPDDEESTDV